MNSGGFSFGPLTSTSNSSFYPGLPAGLHNSSSLIFQTPRFVNRLREFPLDLRYRPVLTPPSTPSPPRKREKNLNLNFKTYEIEQYEPKSNHHMNQFSSTISIDNKKYFQNSVEHVFQPGVFKPQNDKKMCDNLSSEDFIDITNSDNEIEGLNPENDFFQSDSNLTEDLSNPCIESETSDEIVDIESNDDSIVFSEIISTDEIENQNVLENGKMFFEDPKLHSKAIEGFAKLFDNSMCSVPENSDKRNFMTGHHRSKSDRKRVKSRKQMIDEETTSPVSGTIIRKLHDGEELVVRKGDIDPVSLDISISRSIWKHEGYKVIFFLLFRHSMLLK